MPALPSALRLSLPQVCEDLSFDVNAAARGGSSSPPQEQQEQQEVVQEVQSRVLEFTVARDGVLRGLVCWIEIFVADAHAEFPEISSMDVGSSWSNVFLLLSHPTAVEAGAQLKVRSHAMLAGSQPTYRFEVLYGKGMSNDSSAHGEALELLGTLEYPEAQAEGLRDHGKGEGFSEDDCMVEFW